jgi:hypothetical protein
MYEENQTRARSYGAEGSPTFIVNGAKISPSRTAEGIKTEICKAFTNPPVEICGEQAAKLEETTAPLAGNC